MKIDNIKIGGHGRVTCRSGFYTACDILDQDGYTFSTGINQLDGEIDSGAWAASYLLSMYSHFPNDFIVPNSFVTINGEDISLYEIARYTCYMDALYPLFSSGKSVRELVTIGLAQSYSQTTPEQIRDLFYIHPDRFDRPIKAVGHECFKAMAAIGYCYGKQVFCFPWMSRRRFDSFSRHLSELPCILADLKCTVILPVGKK